VVRGWRRVGFRAVRHDQGPRTDPNAGFRLAVCILVADANPAFEAAPRKKAQAGFLRFVETIGKLGLRRGGAGGHVDPVAPGKHARADRCLGTEELAGCRDLSVAGLALHAKRRHTDLVVSAALRGCRQELDRLGAGGDPAPQRDVGVVVTRAGDARFRLRRERARTDPVTGQVGRGRALLSA